MIGIIVYNKRKNRSWKARAAGVDGKTKQVRGPSDCSQNAHKNGQSGTVAWIALAPPCQTKNRTFLYVPESLPHAFGIDVNILKDERKATGDISKHIYSVFNKEGATGAVTYDSRGNIFLGMLSQRTVGIKLYDQSDLELCPPRRNLVRYPGTFAFDNEAEYMYMTEMARLNFAETGVNVRNDNFKLLKWHTGQKSFLYCTNKHH